MFTSYVLRSQRSTEDTDRPDSRVYSGVHSLTPFCSFIVDLGDVWRKH
jgi:hypothetical protein